MSIVNTLKEDTSKEEQQSQQGDSLNTQDNRSSKYEKYEVDDTPFVIIEEPDTFTEGTGEGYNVVLGKYRVSEPFERLHEAMEDAKTITWDRIVQVISVMFEKLEEERKK